MSEMGLPGALEIALSDAERKDLKGILRNVLQVIAPDEVSRFDPSVITPEPAICDYCKTGQRAGLRT